MNFLIEQIAICPKDPKAAIELLTAMGAVDWLHDHVHATGKVNGISGSNEADSSFNDNLTSSSRHPSTRLLELEVLNYTKGPNWMADPERANSISHLGMYVSENALVKWRAFFSNRDIKIAQEVQTTNHTRSTGFYFNIVFDTKAILGFDIKLMCIN